MHEQKFKVRNMESGLCLDTMGITSGNRVQAISCHHLGGNQVSVIDLLMDGWMDGWIDGRMDE